MVEVCTLFAIDNACGVHVTVRCPSVSPFVCLSHLSTAAAACGGFAALGPAGRRYRSISARAVSRRQLTQEAEHRSRCGRRYSYTELRGLVRQDGRVTHWRRLPDLNVTALAYREDIQLRADNRFLLSAEQVMLRDTRQTFQFVLTRPVYHSDVSALEFSLAVVYAGQLRRAGIDLYTVRQKNKTT